MNFNNLPKYAPDNSSISGSHDALNPGPERSKFDVQRHENMKLRYGKRILSTKNSLPPLVCAVCDKGISVNGVTMEGLTMHGECWLARKGFMK